MGNGSPVLSVKKGLRLTKKLFKFNYVGCKGPF